jgi:hypothetical protein
MSGIINGLVNVGSDALGSYLQNKFAMDSYKEQLALKTQLLSSDGLPASMAVLGSSSSQNPSFLPKVSYYRGNNYFSLPTEFSTTGNDSALSNKLGLQSGTVAKMTPPKLQKRIYGDDTIEKGIVLPTSKIALGNNSTNNYSPVNSDYAEQLQFGRFHNKGLTEAPYLFGRSTNDPNFSFNRNATPFNPRNL